MPKIRCQQHECKYNNKSYCIKEGIYVRDDAFCESFKKGHLDYSYAFEFASFEDDEKGIRCLAKNCLHNKECQCRASCICVSSIDTICKTYEDKKR